MLSGDSRALGWLGCALLSGCGITPLPEPAPLPIERLSAFYGEEAGVPPVVSGPLEFRDSSPAIRDEMHALVESAEDYILVDTFLLNDGEETLSRRLLDALIRRHREGIRVYLIGDGSSRWVPEPQPFDYLEAAGVPVAEFHPIGVHKLLSLPELLERDHRKYWIVDGRTIFLGGANLNDPSLRSPEHGGNRDLMVRFQSPAACRSLVDSFVRTWNECRSDLVLDPADFPVADHLPGDGERRLRLWVFNQETPVLGEEPNPLMMDGLLASAEREVWLIQPYLFTNPHILAHCRELTERGVEVNVVVSNAVTSPRFHYASHYGIRGLLKAGARVWKFTSEVSPLHYKCAVVDDRLAYVGSSNLNFRSDSLSRELNVVFDDPEAVAALGEVIDSIRREIRPLTEAEARRYLGPRYLAWWLVMQAAG